MTMATGADSLGPDVLRGAKQIAEFLFGSGDERHCRKVYHLAETSRLPIYRMGAVLHGRKTTLEGWISEQEARSVRGERRGTNTGARGVKERSPPGARKVPGDEANDKPEQSVTRHDRDSPQEERGDRAD